MEKRKKILIIDDNDSLREMLSYALRLSGYGVETACDGLSGLQKLEADSFDLLITDNHMPRMGGLELIEEIYSRNMDIKILFISGELTKEVEERAKGKGVLDCLAKPFSLDLLGEVVSKVLEGKEGLYRQSNFEHHPQLLESAAL